METLLKSKLLNEIPLGSASGSFHHFPPHDLSGAGWVSEFRYSEIPHAIVMAQNFNRDANRMKASDFRVFIASTLNTLSELKPLLWEWSAQTTGQSFRAFEVEQASAVEFLRQMLNKNLEENWPEPRGVSLFLGSTVRPLFYSLYFGVLNILIGNSVILKPAEQVTGLVLALIKGLSRAHPAWDRVQVIVGDREVGRRLACHEGVSVVFFQGSYEVGMRVKQDTLSQPSKEVLLHLGAKNPYIIDQKAHLELALKSLLKDSFLNAGQDCQSAAIAFVHDSEVPKFLESLHEKMKEFRIGSPSEEAFMGPLLDSTRMDRYLKFIGIAEREGAEILMRGKTLSKGTKGNWVTPTLAFYDSLNEAQIKKSVNLQTEILGPQLSVIRFRDQDHLNEMISWLSYGHSCAYWGDSEAKDRDSLKGLPFGKIRYNGGLADFSPLASGQYFKRSGNHACFGWGLFSQLGRTQCLN